MIKLFKEFKNYITEDDILKSASAFLIALTLREVILNFVKLIINPLVSLVFNIKDISKVHFTMLNTDLKIGLLIENIINFFILSFTIFLIIRFLERTKFVADRNGDQKLNEMKNLNQELKKQNDLSNKQIDLLTKLVENQNKGN